MPSIYISASDDVEPKSPLCTQAINDEKKTSEPAILANTISWEEIIKTMERIETFNKQHIIASEAWKMYQTINTSAQVLNYISNDIDETFNLPEHKAMTEAFENLTVEIQKLFNQLLYSNEFLTNENLIFNPYDPGLFINIKNSKLEFLKKLQEDFEVFFTDIQIEEADDLILEETVHFIMINRIRRKLRLTPVTSDNSTDYFNGNLNYIEDKLN